MFVAVVPEAKAPKSPALLLVAGVDANRSVPEVAAGADDIDPNKLLPAVSAGADGDMAPNRSLPTLMPFPPLVGALASDADAKALYLSSVAGAVVVDAAKLPKSPAPLGACGVIVALPIDSEPNAAYLSSPATVESAAPAEVPDANAPKSPAPVADGAGVAANIPKSLPPGGVAVGRAVPADANALYLSSEAAVGAVDEAAERTPKSPDAPNMLVAPEDAPLSAPKAEYLSSLDGAVVSAAPEGPAKAPNQRALLAVLGAGVCENDPKSPPLAWRAAWLMFADANALCLSSVTAVAVVDAAPAKLPKSLLPFADVTLPPTLAKAEYLSSDEGACKVVVAGAVNEPKSPWAAGVVLLNAPKSPCPVLLAEADALAKELTLDCAEVCAVAPPAALKSPKPSPCKAELVPMLLCALAKEPKSPSPATCCCCEAPWKELNPPLLPVVAACAPARAPSRGTGQAGRFWRSVKVGCALDIATQINK